MNIHEYQAKVLLKNYGVSVPDGFLVESLADVEKGCNALEGNVLAVKAQIHAGGRGKAGGVKLIKADNDSEKLAKTQEVVKQMLGSNLVTHQTSSAGQKVRKVYLEEGCNIQKEYYLGLVVDRKVGQVSVIFSTEGGVDIEEVAQNQPDKIVTCYVDPSHGFQDSDGNKLGSAMNLSSAQTTKLTEVIKKVYQLFIENDASQVEINPLVETKEGDFIALDAKINFDDNALYRHSDIRELRDLDEEVKEEIEASKHGLSYIKMDGNIGCMVNGAGLAMATMDIIKYYGEEPANFLDVGGGASRETVTEAFKIILSDAKVKGILVNIFGGIMRCDIIAQGIIEAAKEVSINVPVVVRLSGTNFELGKKILSESGLNIITADDLDDAAKKIVQIVKNK